MIKDAFPFSLHVLDLYWIISTQSHVLVFLVYLTVQIPLEWLPTLKKVPENRFLEQDYIKTKPLSCNAATHTISD